MQPQKNVGAKLYPNRGSGKPKTEYNMIPRYDKRIA